MLFDIRCGQESNHGIFCLYGVVRRAHTVWSGDMVWSGEQPWYTAFIVSNF